MIRPGLHSWLAEKPIKRRTCFKKITSLPLAAGSALRLRFSLDSVLLPGPQGPVQAVHPLLSRLWPVGRTHCLPRATLVALGFCDSYLPCCGCPLHLLCLFIAGLLVCIAAWALVCSWRVAAALPVRCVGCSLRWPLLLSAGPRAGGLGSCSPWALEDRPCGAWGLPGPGTEPVSPASAGGFFTPEPPGMPPIICFIIILFYQTLKPEASPSPASKPLTWELPS